MPILDDFRQTKKISLPSIADSEIEIFDSVLVGDAVGLDLASKDEIKIGVDLLPKFIKSWNFTDKAGKALAITKENIGLLKIEDLVFLTEEIKKFALENKKK